MKKLKNIIIYIVCGVLVLFFGVVLVFAKNPKISDEYRLYYITHDLKTWPGEGNFTYTPGTVEYMGKPPFAIFKRCLRLGSGWLNDEFVGTDGIINSDTESFLYYKFDENIKNGKMIIDVSGFHNPNSDYEITELDSSAQIAHTLFKNASYNPVSDRKAEVYIKEQGGDDVYLGEFAGVGRFEFKLPRLDRGKVYVVTLKAEKYTYRIKSITINN